MNSKIWFLQIMQRKESKLSQICKPFWNGGENTFTTRNAITRKCEWIHQRCSNSQVQQLFVDNAVLQSARSVCYADVEILMEEFYFLRPMKACRKTRSLLSTCQKLSCGSISVSSFIRPFLQQNDTQSTSFTYALSFKLVQIDLHSSSSKFFAHVAAVEINENSLLEAKKKQLNIVFFLWTNTLIVEKKGFQLKWTLVAVQSKKKQNSFFLDLGRKKNHINTDISLLQKGLEWLLSPSIIVTRRNVKWNRLECLAFVKKVLKKKPYCSNVCLCIQTFSTWYCRKTFQSVDH